MDWTELLGVENVKKTEREEWEEVVGGQVMESRWKKRARVCVFRTQSLRFSPANKEKLSRGTRPLHPFLPLCSLSSIYPFLGLSSPCCTLSLSFMISAARICTSSSQWKINSTQRTSSPQWSTSTVKRTHGHIDSGFLKDTHKQMSALKVSIHKEGYTHSFVHLSCCFPSV